MAKERVIDWQRVNDTLETQSWARELFAGIAEETDRWIESYRDDAHPALSRDNYTTQHEYGSTIFDNPLFREACGAIYEWTPVRVDT